MPWLAAALILGQHSAAHGDELLASQEHAQISEGTCLTSLRIAAGTNLVFGSDTSLAAAADLTAGVRLYAPMGPPRLVLLPDLGYSYAGNASSSAHLLTAGIGLGVGALTPGALGLAWTPRIVLSPADSGAVGVRNGLLVDLAGLATMELSHQYLPIATNDEHSIRVTFGFDLGIAVQALTSHRRPR